MHNSSRHKSSQDQLRRRDPPPQPRRRSWCCSFTVPPSSPQNPSHSPHKLPQKSDVCKLPLYTLPNSTQNNKYGLVGRIDHRRILSPGRVSPIDDPIQQPPTLPSNFQAEEEAVDYDIGASTIGDVQPKRDSLPALLKSFSSSCVREEGNSAFIFDVRMNLKGKNGGSLVLELNSEVLSANSSVFAQLIDGYRKESRSNSPVNSLCRIEVPEVENLNVFRETIELMFQDDVTKQLQRIGPYRSIDILEVAAGINFTNAVFSCLKYLEAVPWSEQEEEKLRSLFTRANFADTITKDIFARLNPTDTIDSPRTLAKQLVLSITSSSDTNARTELKFLVKGLLFRSSVYRTDHPDLTKEDIYSICNTCLYKLNNLFEAASSGNDPSGDFARKEITKSFIERVSIQVDNIIWLLEILINWQMADEFVDMWAQQKDLLSIHENASPFIRYELSRVSAILFIAMGTRKIHCRGESRLRLLQAWLGPMLLDFGWLQRCRKGLDIRALEEALGQAILTLPLNQQYILFMDWFGCFTKNGTECPNLSKAFQIWWRRSFLAGSGSNSIDLR